MPSYVEGIHDERGHPWRKIPPQPILRPLQPGSAMISMRSAAI
jgi:hypothetical protein